MLRVFLGIVILVAVLVLSGAAYEALASRGDAAKLPPPGRLVDIGGYRLHLNCSGDGSPTIVLDAGLGESSLDWVLVQPQLARSTRVCSYDRAGMGWSDPSPQARTPANMAEELHTLLANAHVSGPYVLVGHSLAGKTARMFALRHPDDVAGVVLIDARHESLDASPAENQAFVEQVDAQGRTYDWARRLGVARLFGTMLAGAPALPAETRSAMAILGTRPNTIAATSAEARARSANDAELTAATLGDRPLVVLVAGQSLTNIPHWEEAQRRHAALSSRGELRISQNSGHAIQWDDPQLVVASIEEVVAAARAP